MATILKRDDLSRDFPDITYDELIVEWNMAKKRFDQALVQKTETDRIFVAAATRLNALERLVKKVERRAVVDKRSAAKALLRTA